jgi:spore germination protein YaaH
MAVSPRRLPANGPHPTVLGSSSAPRLRVWPAVLAAMLAVGGILAEPSAVAPISNGSTASAATPRPDPGLRARSARPPAASHEIYGYLPYWQVDAGTARRIDYRTVTTIAFFAIPVQANGTLNRASAGYRAYVGRAARAITNAAHAHGVRVVPTFQLFDGGQLAKMRQFLHSRAAQTRFIHQAISLMIHRRADGANVDFEPVPRSLAAPFASFIARFGRAIHARFPRSQLVVATPALASIQLIERLAPAVDRFFIMAYDYRWSGSRIPGAVAPLTGGGLNVEATVRRYLGHAPASKLILGVPLYGYSWPVARTSRGIRVRAEPGRWGGVHGVTYAAALNFLRRHPRVRLYTEAGRGAWFRYWDAAHHTMREVHFEDAGLARAKFNHAIERGLAGVGLWALGSDRGTTAVRSALLTTYVRPTRRVAFHAWVSRPRVVRGVIELSAAIVVANRGNRAELGQVYWRVYGPRGRLVAGGSRVVVLGVGGSARLSVQLQLGRASRRASGIYRLVTSFRSDNRIWWSSSKRFWQPY